MWYYHLILFKLKHQTLWRWHPFKYFWFLQKPIRTHHLHQILTENNRTFSPILTRIFTCLNLLQVLVPLRSGPQGAAGVKVHQHKSCSFAVNQTNQFGRKRHFLKIKSSSRKKQIETVFILVSTRRSYFKGSVCSF